MEWAGDYDAAVGLYQRAYRGFRERGETRRPAQIAGRELSFLHAAVFGNIAVANGWLSRAKRLVETAGDCPERGWIGLAEALITDDPDEKDPHIQIATQIARRFGDVDLEFCAMGYEGACLILRGRIPDGMRRLDESAAAAASGEVQDYLAVGEIYCKMLLCCELVLDVQRAQQWIAVAESFSRTSNAPWVSAICRMHYGGILTAAGRWTEAEAELAAAIEKYDNSYRALRSSAIVRLADLRVRQGRHDEAVRLLAGHESDPHAVLPLARVHLARGEAELAATVLRRFLDAAGEHLVHAPVLALLAEVDVEMGRLDEARELASRLHIMTAGARTPYLRALAAHAAGVACSAPCELTAVAHFERALSGFAAAGLPLEEARTRLALARLVLATDPVVATAEARAAHEAFQGLDAKPDADAAASLLRSLGSRAPPGPRIAGALTNRESQVLRLVAGGLSNEQIARRLFISKRTVEHHVGSILAKLGLSTRAEALAYAVRHGFL